MATPGFLRLAFIASIVTKYGSEDAVGNTPTFTLSCATAAGPEPTITAATRTAIAPNVLNSFGIVPLRPSPDLTRDQASRRAAPLRTETSRRDRGATLPQWN